MDKIKTKCWKKLKVCKELTTKAKKSYLCANVYQISSLSNLKQKKMKTEEIALSRVSENEENPREISQANFQKLVQSIIVFPRMLTLRPIVIDETFHALGGNMRLKALQHIVTMDEASIQVKLDAEQRLSDEDQAALMEYWQGWQQQPTVTVVSASDLTEAQKQEFMIKDNLSFGNWDFNDLANRWDSAQLQNWGMPVWNPAPAEASSTSKCKKKDKDDKEGDPFAGELPPEIEGKDLNPDDLPTIMGDCVLPRENVIIHYKPADEPFLAKLLGVDHIDRIVWNFDELKPRQEGKEEDNV